MLRVHLLPLFAVAALAAADPADTATSADAWRIGWPNQTGPTGNLLPLRTPTALVDDPAQARVLWISENADLGSAKTGSKTWASSAAIESRIGPEPRVHPGNWAGVVVADGRVFAASFTPAGELFTAPYRTGKDQPEVPTRFRVEADDLVICYDAETGTVLWKAREPGGLILSGGKRGGFQVAPAVDAGRVFAVGSTGRVFAYDAVSGAKRWQADVGGAHQAAEKQRLAAIATAQAGQMALPDGPDWFTSVVAADGVVVTGSFAGRGDVGLRAYDAATGAPLWQQDGCLSRYATPNLWRHDGRAYLLCGSLAGTLRLFDLKTGALQWRLDGLGPMWTTLCPGERTVLVNVRPSAGKRTPGRWGAVRLAPDKAEVAWMLPDEPAYHFPVWLDTGARQTAFVRDGRALVHTEGDKDNPGRVLLLDEETGRPLGDVRNGTDLGRMRELILWLGDRALVREDHSHGARHGGRHPLVIWRTTPETLAPELQQNRHGGIDLIDFETAYEVLLHVPLVDGRMFERTDDGRLACYDLRRIAAQEVAVDLLGAQPGLPPVPVRLWHDGARVLAAKAWAPDSVQAGLPWGRERRTAMWQRADASGLRIVAGRLSGALVIDNVTHRVPLAVDIALADGGGTWTRSVPALPATTRTEGSLSGRVGDERVFPTPWLAEAPWTRIGANPSGTRTWVLQLDGAVTVREAPKDLTLCLDHDGTGFVRAAGAAFTLTQAWHEVDTSALRIEGDRLGGTVTVLLNRDGWVALNGDHAVAGTLTIAAQRQADGTLTGTFSAEWGVAWRGAGATTAAR